MSTIKRILTLSFGLLLFADPVIAGRSVDLAREFATCLGRYSAEMEHRHILGEPSDGQIARVQTFGDLLEAVQPDAAAQGLKGYQIVSLQVEAKFAQAQLLQMASFNRDARMARSAQHLARRQLSACEMLLLG